MPDVLAFLCYLVAFVAFVLIGLGIGEVRRFVLIGIGLAAWVLVPLIHAWPG